MQWNKIYSYFFNYSLSTIFNAVSKRSRCLNDHMHHSLLIASELQQTDLTQNRLICTWMCMHGKTRKSRPNLQRFIFIYRHTTPRTCDSWTAASRNAKLSGVQPVASKQPISQSCGLRDLGRIVSTTDESIVWMNWNGGLSMFSAAFNSRLLTRLLTSGDEDIERRPCYRRTFRVQPVNSAVNWQCWFCPYLLHSMRLVWLLHL